MIPSLSLRLAASLLVAALAVPGCSGTSSDVTESTTGVAEQALTGTVTVNAATRYQTMQGWGVDGQPRSWGNTGAHMKTQVLDPLVDDMGSNLFRVEIYKGASDWEATNDDASPSTYNWSYYDNLYSTNKDFQDFVAYVRYLNGKGITAIEVAAHGLAPTWMAGSHNGLAGACVTNESGCTGVPANGADEWAEEIVSFVEWAHNRLNPPLQFSWVAPFNETDLCTTEGICLGGDTSAVVSLLSKIVTRMNAFPDLAAIKLVAPEAAGAGDDFRAAILTNSTVAPRIAALAYHIYSPGSAPAANSFNTASPPEWNTEFNGFSSICANAIGWSEAKTHADLLVADLAAGNTVELVWADVDAWHIHQNNFQTFGILFTSFAASTPPVADANRCGMGAPPSATQLDGAVYSPNVTYHATKQFSKFVKPGAQRVSVALSDGANGAAVAFVNPDGSVVVAGRNKSATSGQSITLGISGLTQHPTSLTQYYTNATSRFVKDPTTYALTTSAGVVTSGPVVIPPDSVFTLVTSGIDPTVTMQTPTPNEVFAGGPSTVSFTATAAASSGRSIASVGYYQGTTLLCSSTTAPTYACSSSLGLGTHTSLTAKATDNTSATGSSAPISVYVQGVAPTVTITGPVATGTFTVAAGASVPFAATASAASGLSIARVDFVEGSTVLCSASASPYSCTWTAPSSGGSHTVVAKAVDSSAHQAQSSAITVAVTGPTLLLGDTAIEAGDDTTSAGFVDAYQYTAGASGTVATLDAYAPGTNAATSMQLGLYTDSSGKPGTLLRACTVASVTKNAWNTCTLSTGVPVTAGTSYWIAAMTTAGSVTVRVSGAGTNCWSSASVGSSLPSTFASTCAAGQASMYAAATSGSQTTVPGAPTGATATAGNAQATVSWSAPSSNGGSAITGYTVTSSPGSFHASTTGATSATVTGLTNGTAYTFTVVATNAVGNSAASSPSNAVTPSAGSAVLLGDAAIETTPDATTAGHLDAYLYTATAGTLNQLCVYVPAASASTSLTLGLYTNAASAPGTLVAGTSVTLGALTKGAWNCKALAAGVGISATSYWIVALSTAGTSTLEVTTASGTNCWDTGGATYSSLPASFPASQCGGGKASLKGMN